MRCFLYLACVVLPAAPLALEAQGAALVGSEQERYLRWLGSAGLVPAHQWTIRPFSPRESQRLAPPDSGHPWAKRGEHGPQPLSSQVSRLAISLLPASVTTYVNSTFPWGYNDGPVWQGRGLTTSLSAGVAARVGPVSLTLAPIAFWAQNAGFRLQTSGHSDSLPFADGRFPISLDAPQRFGDGSYARLDPGQSTLRMDVPGVTAGVSTASQWWGPAVMNPILLGNNAPGFRHVFLGTSEPLDLWVARLHGRVVWGDLRQSRFTRNLPPTDRRFSSGLAAVLQPRGVPGLEIGGARFFHQHWPQSGLALSDFTKPFTSFLRSQRPTGSDTLNPGADPDNQLASIWLRWNAPADGFEVYAEYAKEDDNWDLRDLIGEPENSGGYQLGLRRLWGFDPAGFWGLEIEHLDLRPSQYVLGRSGGTFYVHSRERQGHTQVGQLLGSPFGTGGLATQLGLDRYHQRGRWRLAWTRVLRQDFQRLAYDPLDPYQRVRHVAALDPEGYDVLQAVGAEAVLFRGPWELSGGVTAMYDFNRNLGDDAANLNAWVGVRWNPRESVSARQEQPLPRVQRAEAASEGTDRPLLRSASSVAAGDRSADGRLRIRPIALALHWVHNTALPFSLNDGPLWAGAGSNLLLSGGVRAQWGPISLWLAPELAYSANRPFEMPDPVLFPTALPAGRDSLASPWHIRPGSIDLPVRFGTESLRRLYPGQSTLQVTSGAIAAGVSTERHWWGPGIRNAIVLSDNAPGFGHLFVRTGGPLRTRVGAFEGRWLAGGLRESGYFDDDSTNNLRTISALALTWRPKWVPDLTVGLTRSVYAPAESWGDVPLALFDVLLSFPGRPNDRTLGDSTQVAGPDQIYSWFARWALPRTGLEVYGEFAKTELPASVRDFLITPGHTLGYTLGLQWARPVTGNAVIRVQAEHTFLERSSTFRQRSVGTYYTSPAVIQGYTNEGQVLGAAIGPGASSHWLAVDYVAPGWEVGLFGGRIRWENDALYTVPLVNPYISYWCMHDVSVFGGVRGAWAGAFGSVSASISTGTRFNVHFQNFGVCGRDFRPEQAVDVGNKTLELKWVAPF